MQSRIPLLNTLRRAFRIAVQSEQPGNPSSGELIDQYRYNTLHRRKFIGDIMKTGVAVGAAGFFNACRKANELAPTSSMLQGESIASAAASKVSEPGIVIIGAGIAGLNCAYQLKKSGYSATIYEAANRTGGRMFTKPDIIAPNLYTELGGEFIDTEHKDMLQLCKEFNLPLIDTRTREELEYERDSFYIEGRFYSEAEVINAFQPYAARIAADIRSLPDTMTFENHDATTLHFDLMSISAYFDSIGMTGFIRRGIEIAYVTEYGLEADVQSSINFLYLFSPKTNQGFEIFGSSDERYKIQGGNQTLTNLLYEQVKNKVILEQQLVRIKGANNSYALTFRKGSTTTTINANIIVSTIPFSVLREVELDVALPAWKQNAINKLDYGHNSKLLLGFKSRVWRNYNYSGYVFTDEAIQTGWDNSFGQTGNNGGFTVYGGGNAGLALGTGTAESQSTKFLEEVKSRNYKGLANPKRREMK